MKIVWMISLLFLAACNKKKPNIEIVQNMMESPAYKAQDYDRDKGKPTQMLPPKNTIAIGEDKVPYKYASDPAGAAANLKNPFEATVENLEKGQVVYETYCLVCHGATAAGNGMISKYWPAPIPALTTAKIKGWPDGGIYHVVRAGQGLMSSYATQIREEDRWKVVLYVRKLQKEYSE